MFLTASIAVLYGVPYFLMGGYEDTGPIYAVVVAGIFIFGIAMLAILARRRNLKD